MIFKSSSVIMALVYVRAIPYSGEMGTNVFRVYVCNLV